MMLRHSGGDFFGSRKTSILFNSPDKRMSPTGSGALQGATEENAAAGGTGKTLERRDWDALGEGPHGNVLYIINNMCLYLRSVTTCCCHSYAAIRIKRAAGCIYTASLCGSEST